MSGNYEVFFLSPVEIAAEDWRDEEGRPLGAGWYRWTCCPGCLPDSEPDGPYETEAEATEAARDGDEDDPG